MPSNRLTCFTFSRSRIIVYWADSLAVDTKSTAIQHVAQKLYTLTTKFAFVSVHYELGIEPLRPLHRISKVTNSPCDYAFCFLVLTRFGNFLYTFICLSCWPFTCSTQVPETPFRYVCASTGIGMRVSSRGPLARCKYLSRVGTLSLSCCSRRYNQRMSASSARSLSFCLV
ncbi:unnamed protein product [Trichogramma brassicae]|uniref:Uncharacterized protein n=1 Tax=Trichogramma brassicae TaxID=86971 RepID=A0A6H5IE34_9HYME|nr:unnamed protein product [Trichogramma brassicae]